jgi:hypothetical protein
LVIPSAISQTLVVETIGIKIITELAGDQAQ